MLNKFIEDLTKGVRFKAQYNTTKTVENVLGKIKL